MKSLEELKQELELIKAEIRIRHEAGEESDELVQRVVEATRLARTISEMI